MVKILSEDPEDCIFVCEKLNGYNLDSCICIAYPKSDSTFEEICISPEEAQKLSEILAMEALKAMQKIEKAKMPK